MVFNYPANYEAKNYTNKEIKTFYKNKKLFVFDLDDTLYNNFCISGDIVLTSEYKENLYNFIKNLKNSGKILAIASHNAKPKETFKTMKVCKFFDEDLILGPKHIYENEKHLYDAKKLKFSYFADYTYYPRKSEMIKELMEKFNVNTEEVIFFDDDPGHIYDVDKNLNVTSIHVKRGEGIPAIM